jgi:hypothetical protein
MDSNGQVHQFSQAQLAEASDAYTPQLPATREMSHACSNQARADHHVIERSLIGQQAAAGSAAGGANPRFLGQLAQQPNRERGSGEVRDVSIVVVGAHEPPISNDGTKPPSQRHHLHGPNDGRSNICQGGSGCGGGRSGSAAGRGRGSSARSHNISFGMSQNAMLPDHRDGQDIDCLERSYIWLGISLNNMAIQGRLRRPDEINHDILQYLRERAIFIQQNDAAMVSALVDETLVDLRRERQRVNSFGDHLFNTVPAPEILAVPDRAPPAEAQAPPAEDEALT